MSKLATYKIDLKKIDRDSIVNKTDLYKRKLDSVVLSKIFSKT